MATVITVLTASRHAVRSSRWWDGAVALGPENGGTRMNRDVFTLLCPDWRGPAIVLEGAMGHIVHANWPALRLLERPGPLGVACGRLTFKPAEMNQRFFGKLEWLLASGAERAAVAVDEEARRHWITAMIHVPVGFARDVLERELKSDYDVTQLVIVEFFDNTDIPDPVAFAALAEALALAPAESQLIAQLIQGRTPAEIARGRGTSVSTVRQRIKSVLAKTQCARQSALVNFVRTLCPPVASPGAPAAGVR
jgi:DNA-binding CsgD family transcriptional regulator